MKLSIQERDLTITKEFFEAEDRFITTEEVLIGAYDIISRIYGQKAVIGAYYRTDPDTMDLRAEDDDFLKHVKFFGYDDRKED